MTRYCSPLGSTVTPGFLALAAISSRLACGLMSPAKTGGTNRVLRTAATNQGRMLLLLLFGRHDELKGALIGQIFLCHALYIGRRHVFQTRTGIAYELQAALVR